MSIFYSCFNGLESCDEFEKTWHDMIAQFKWEVNSRLSDLYNIRSKRYAPLNKDVFSAGILSTQRRERTINVLNDI